MAALLLSSTGIAVAAVLNIYFHDRAFLLMLAISMFGPMFAWFMIFVTHLRFRRHHANTALLFRMWGYPWTSLLGGLLMLAALITTAFTREFRPTLLYGVSLLIALSLAYSLRRRTRSPRRTHHP